MMSLPAGSNINKEQQDVVESVRSGAYFDESRRWYQTLYIGPISERTFFLIIATLASAVAICGIVAVLSLLPVTERPSILVSNPRMDETAMGLQRMRSRQQTLNPAVRSFFLKQYVFMRESFDAANYTKDYAFVHAHSGAAAFAAYAQGFAPTNPQSPLVTLGEYGQRIARIHSAEVNETTQPMTATVRFSTETIMSDKATIEQWTATIGFHYSDLAVTPVQDPATGELRVQTQEPVFQVVQYERNPVPAAP